MPLRLMAGMAVEMVVVTAAIAAVMVIAEAVGEQSGRIGAPPTIRTTQHPTIQLLITPLPTTRHPTTRRPTILLLPLGRRPG